MLMADRGDCVGSGRPEPMLRAGTIPALCYDPVLVMRSQIQRTA